MEHGAFACPFCGAPFREVIDLFLGFLLMGISIMLGVIFILILSLPLISAGVGAYYAIQFWEKPTVHERMEERVKLPPTPEDLYEKIWTRT